MTIKLHLGVIDVPYAASHASVTARGRAHGAPSTMSTGDVAQILEARYGLMGTFFQMHEQEIADDIAEGMRDKLETLLMGGPADTDTILDVGTLSSIEQRFRQALDRSEFDGRVPGVPTAAALAGVSHRLTHPYARRGARPSFIDTGQYQASMRAWVEED